MVIRVAVPKTSQKAIDTHPEIFKSMYVHHSTCIVVVLDTQCRLAFTLSHFADHRPCWDSACRLQLDKLIHTQPPTLLEGGGAEVTKLIDCVACAPQELQQAQALAARRPALGPQWRCTATRACLAPAAAVRQAEVACRDQAGCSSSSSSSRGAWRLGAAPWQGSLVASRPETTSGWLTCWVSSPADTGCCTAAIIF